MRATVSQHREFWVLYQRARKWYTATQLSGKKTGELEKMIAERETK